MLINHGPSLTNRPPKTLAPEAAERLAADLQAGDPDWAYTVKHCPKGTGFSIIAIYDEDGEFVSHWG